MLVQSVYGTALFLKDGSILEGKIINLTSHQRPSLSEADPLLQAVIPYRARDLIDITGVLLTTCQELPIQIKTITEYMRFILPGNFIGLPAISIPAGQDEKGLPIGLQINGRHWEEHLLLKLAYAAEQHIERKKPEVYYDLLKQFCR